MKYFIFCTILFITCCTAQKRNQSPDEGSYLKSHELLANILGRDRDTIYMLERFDFSNQRKLAETALFDKMFRWRDSYYLSKTVLELSQEEMDMVRDRKGWRPPTLNNNYNTWDISLFKENKIKLVQEIKKQGLIKPGQKVYIYIKPLQVNFRQNFALIEFENLMGDGNELRLYKNLKGKWRLVAAATDAKFSQE